MLMFIYLTKLYFYDQRASQRAREIIKSKAEQRLFKFMITQFIVLIIICLVLNIFRIKVICSKKRTQFQQIHLTAARILKIMKTQQDILLCLREGKLDSTQILEVLKSFVILLLRLHMKFFAILRGGICYNFFIGH